MSIKVGYVGSDLRFFGHIKSVIDEKVNDQVEYVQYEVNDDFVAANVFIQIFEAKLDIIYIDLFYIPEKGLSLCKLLCRNNETRLKSTVLIHDQNQGDASLLRGVLSGARLNYYKSAEPKELAAHPFMLLDAAYDAGDEYASGTNLKGLYFKQILRIGYVAQNHYRIETSCKLKEQSVVELNTHPLSVIMPSPRFLVENFSDNDLYYNQRFSYDLRFTYLNNEFFKASEQSWVNYKKANIRKKLNQKEREDQPYILADVEKRVRLYQPVKEEIKQWLAENRITNTPKRLKVLVLDETLEIFKEYSQNPKDFPFSINFQTKLTKDFFQVRRFRPHLIIYHMGEDFEVLKKIVEEIKVLEGYNPSLLVFNYKDNSAELRKNVGYEQIMASKESVQLELIKKMAEVLGSKGDFTSTDDKVFLKTTNPRSVATILHSGEIIKFNQSEMLFATHLDIPMWTTLILEAPLKALITVIPTTEKIGSSVPVYRALINGVGELQENELRRLVNKSLEEPKDVEDEDGEDSNSSP